MSKLQNKSAIQLLSLALLVFAVISSSNTQVFAQQGPANSLAEYQKNYEYRIKQAYLNDTYIPEGLTDAFIQLKKLIGREDLTKFKAAPETSIKNIGQYSLADWIVHNWGFHGGSRLSHFLKNIGLTHPNDMAAFVIITFHRSLNDLPLDAKPLADLLKEERKEKFSNTNQAKKAIQIHNEKVLEKKKQVATSKEH